MEVAVVGADPAGQDQGRKPSQSSATSSSELFLSRELEKRKLKKQQTLRRFRYSRVPNCRGVPNKRPGKTLDLNLINVLSQINVLVGQLAEI